MANQFDASVSASYAQAAASGNFGDKPLIVLTRGKVNMPADPTTEDTEFAAYEQIWKNEIQPKLAGLSTRGRQKIVEKSGHRIHEEAPDVVIAAITELLAEVRAVPPTAGAIARKH